MLPDEAPEPSIADVLEAALEDQRRSILDFGDDDEREGDDDEGL